MLVLVRDYDIAYPATFEAVVPILRYVLGWKAFSYTGSV
jgi:hypothetical protein